MYSILPLVLVVLSSVQIIFHCSWEEEPLKTLKRIIRRFLWLSPITSKKSRLRKGKQTSCKKLVVQNACSCPTSKSVMMIVRELMKRWKLLGQRIVQSSEFMATESFVGYCFFMCLLLWNNITGTFNFVRCKFNLVSIISHHNTIIYEHGQHSV